MNETRQHIQALLDTLGERKRGFRYPAQVREVLQDFALVELQAGASRKELSDFLGVSTATLKRWLEDDRESEDSPSFAPIFISEPLNSPQDLTLRSPSGWTLSGLDLKQATELLRSLS